MRKTILITLLAITLSACGSGGGESSSSSSSAAPATETSKKVYNGTGSKWKLTLNSDNTCKIEEEYTSLVINATCEALDSGFFKITVNSTAGPDAPETGAATYGFELSGYMFPFVSFTDKKLLPTIISGNCPSENIKHNFVVSFARGNSSTSNFDEWGTFGYWETNRDDKTLNVKVYNRNGNLMNEHNINDFDLSSLCSNGYFYHNNTQEGSKTTAYFSESGGLIWNQASTKDQRIENDFMIPYDDGITALSQLDGNYIGYTISGNGQTSYTNTPVSVTASNGAFTLNSIEEFASGDISSQIHSSFTLKTEVLGTRGLFRGEITKSDGKVATNSEGLGCAIDLNAGNSGKNVIICGGMLPDGTKKNLYSAILVSK